jgi:hypothetical protein
MPVAGGGAGPRRSVRWAATLALAAAAACGGSDQPSAPASPLPTPTPPPQVTIALVAARPPSGSVLSSREPVPVTLDISVSSSQDTPGSFLRVELVSGATRCLAAEARGAGLRANVPALFVVGPFVTDPLFVACAAPFTTTSASVRFFPAADPTFLTPTGTAQLAAGFQFR